MAEASRDAVRVGEGLGASARAVIDLAPPDDVDYGRFHSELAELIALLFTAWRPGAAGAVPLASPLDVADRLATGWREVWFPPAERPGTVEPLIAHPWIRVEPEAWPFRVEDAGGRKLDVQEWTGAGGGWLSGPWIRISGAPVQPVELRVRPDRARGGRVHIEVRLQLDLYAEAAAGAPPARSDRAASHALALGGLWEDLHVLYRPVLAEGTGVLAPHDDAAAAERTLTRLLQRADSAQRGGTLDPPREVAAWLRAWLARLERLVTPESEPMWANARAAIDAIPGGGFAG
jgi:hypothetical protein